MTSTFRPFCWSACLAIALLTTACKPPPTDAIAPPPPPSSHADGDEQKPKLTPPLPTPDELACVDAIKLLQTGKKDEALQTITAVVATNPKNIPALMLQAQLYSAQKRLDEAQACYETVLKIDEKNVAAKFDLSELKFMQKEYDQARAGFVALKDDPQLGDFIGYKIFLCDLLNGKEDVARGELDAFQEASNASCYFGNLAWSLYHHQPEEGRKWLQSALRIYAPAKIERYAFSLHDLGYLPIPEAKKDDSAPALDDSAPPSAPATTNAP